MDKDKADISIGAIAQQIGVLVPALLPLFHTDPIWGAIFAVIYGFFPALMQLKQERVNEISEFIQEHPEEFRKEIVQSPEFGDGFLIFFEEYLKSRAKTKREILKRIILGFAISEDKEKYELERLSNCLERITLQSLEFLVFIKSKIIPILNNKINDELKQDYYQKSDRSIEWWHLQLLTQKSAWELISQWLHDEFSTETQKVKEEYGIKNNEGWIADLKHRAETREKEKSTEIYNCIVELVTLGIFDFKISGGFGGSGGKDYNLTYFGISFLKYIEN
ncbi:hypothetical protein KKE60_08455 [Patescibacteria group bacterium]|nr:hypothetical protein [Patescibacteria group bacterium]